MKVIKSKRIIFIFFIAAYATNIYSQNFDSDGFTTLLNAKNNHDISLENQLLRYDSLYRQYSDSNSQLAFALFMHEKGKLFYRYGELHSAIATTKVAIDLRMTLKDPELYASIINIGVFYTQLRDYTNAIFFLKQGLLNDSNNLRYIKTLTQLGRVYMLIGRYHLANDMFNKGEEICKNNFPFQKERLLIFQNQLYIYFNSDIHPSLTEVEDKLNELEHVFSEEHDDILLHCKLNLASLYFKAKDYEQLIRISEEILDKEIEDIELKITAINNIAYSKIMLGEYNSAYTLLRECVEQNLPPFLATYIYNNLGEYFLVTEQFDSSQYYFQKSINILLNNNPNDYLKNDLLSVSPYKTDLLTSYNDLTRVFVERFKKTKEEKYLINTLSIFKQIDFLIDQIRLTNSEDQTLYFWRKEVKPIYDNAIQIAYQANQIEDAFYFAEKSKAIVLLDEMIKSKSGDATYIPDKLTTSERNIKSKILNLEVELQASQAEKKDSLSSLLINLRIELNRIIEEIKDFAPQYVRTKYTPPISSAESLQSKLKKDECFVDFIWADSVLYRFIIDKAKIDLKAISMDKDFQEELSSLIYSTRTPNSDINNIKSINKNAHKLYLALFSEANISRQRMIISPDGQLNFLPFEALITSIEGKKLNYLIQEKTISYVFSGNTGFYEKSNPSEEHLVGFAPTFYKKDLNLSKLSFVDYELTPLQALEGILFTNEAANKKQFFDIFPNSKLIHIYSHGVANSENDAYPWIAAYDELIYLPEIYNHKTNADLVILSACETNLGKSVEGEGVISLARGFFHAGAKSVLASLWKVNDRSNAEIVYQFYKFLAKGKTKADALRLSKLKYLEESYEYNQSPYYWAGLIFIGQDDRLTLEKNKMATSWKIIGGFLASLFLIIFGVIKFMRK